MKNTLSLFIILFFISCSRNHKQFLIKEDIIFPNRDFSQVESYSFNIADKETYRKFEIEASELNKKYYYSKKHQDNLFSDIEKSRLAKINSLLEGERILNSQGDLAKSAKLKRRLSKNEINELSEILRINELDFPQIEAECYYPRDAIIFKDKEKIIGYIEICFECYTIKFSPEINVTLREKNYLSLIKFMKELGHKVEK